MTSFAELILAIEDNYPVVTTHDLVAIKMSGGTSRKPYYIYKNRHGNTATCVGQREFSKYLKLSQYPILFSEGRKIATKVGE